MGVKDMSFPLPKALEGMHLHAPPSTRHFRLVQLVHEVPGSRALPAACCQQRSTSAIACIIIFVLLYMKKCAEIVITRTIYFKFGALDRESVTAYYAR